MERGYLYAGICSVPAVCSIFLSKDIAPFMSDRTRAAN